MKPPRALGLLLLLLAVPMVFPAAPSNSPPAKTVRLLTVGNSFSQNATRHLPGLVKAAGHELIHHPLVVGGATLELHWGRAQAFEQDPQDKRGYYTNTARRSLKEELVSEPWDFVTIQQASIRSHDLATYRPFAGQLHAYIQQHAPRAQVLVHQTWAYRCDDPRFSAKSPKPGEPATREAMYAGLTAAYTTVAAELGARLLPVGDAFHRADSDPQWGYKPDLAFDFKSAQPPALPDQKHSLHVGWAWKKQGSGPSALRMDGHHAGLAGEYLGACVFFEVLFGESVVGNSYLPPGLDPAYAQFLRQTAHQAVAGAAARPAMSAPPTPVSP